MLSVTTGLINIYHRTIKWKNSYPDMLYTLCHLAHSENKCLFYTYRKGTFIYKYGGIIMLHTCKINYFNTKHNTQVPSSDVISSLCGYFSVGVYVNGGTSAIGDS